MASFTERGGRVTARVRKGGFTVADTFSTKRDAEAWARGIEADIERGRYVAPAKAQTEAATAPAPARTMADAIKDYRAQVLPTMKGADTYRPVWAGIAALPLAQSALTAITPADIAALRDAWLARGLKAGTVARRMGMLGGFFSWCCDPERGWLTVSPAKVKKPTVRDARERVLSDEEATAILEAAKSKRAPWLAPVFQVLMQTAMRRGELVAVRVSDVQISTSTIRLHDSKNGDARDVPLCPTAVKAVGKLLLLAHAREDKRLVPADDPHSLTRAFQRVLERARVGKPEGFLADVRLHDLRHTAATKWASTGALTVFELQRITGHRDVRSLNRYVNIAPADVAKKLAAIAA